MTYETNMKRTAELRGNVVNRFAQVESMIDIVIALYYLGGSLTKEFHDDVLTDEHFSFALRRSLLEKLLRREGCLDTKKMERLHRLNRVRNLMAHMGKIEVQMDGSHGFVDPRDPSKPLLDAEELATEFDEIYREIQPYMHDLMGRVHKKFRAKAASPAPEGTKP